MTPNKEDYLKMIFELGGDTQLISNKQIVIGLDVSAASVSEMITKLVEQHYVTHTPYQGIKLTATGQKRAALLVRNHRLWEVFWWNHCIIQWIRFTKKQNVWNTRRHKTWLIAWPKC